MPIPYTLEAVAALRHAAATHTPSSEIQRHLGWDNSMLTRVCRKHGIDLVVATAEVAEALPPQLAPIAPYPPMVARILAKLTPLQTQIFHILRRRANDGTWIKGADIAGALGRATDPGGVRSVAQIVARIARRMERMRTGYLIETQTGPDGGYRLVLDEGAR